jgi:hypothetical protein
MAVSVLSASSFKYVQPGLARKKSGQKLHVPSLQLYYQFVV